MCLLRFPPWLKVKAVSLEQLAYVDDLLRGAELNTVCESAKCPNLGECFSKKTATFLIMGDICTRGCRFCAVPKGMPEPPDPAEPARLSRTVLALGLRHVVITSVTRDDLPDGGAAHFAGCIGAIRKGSPGVRVEVLVPDFQGSAPALSAVVTARPEVINHNIETVPRLYPDIRINADYRRSLKLLEDVKRLETAIITKSGLMLGLGESEGEVLESMRDLRAAGCDMLTIGQYLSPSPAHARVVRYVEPAEFAEYRVRGLAMGFRHVASAPLVRSSYHAGEAYGAAGPSGSVKL